MSQVLIITGMGRSGTSLVSSLLQSAGVHIGDRLLPPYPDNPRGYFEDVDFYEFHENLLHTWNQTYLYVDADFAFKPTPVELERARQLICERSTRSVWGWKDPRTTLFLDLWYQLLPQARFLFVYRHPIEVLLSLLRRGEFDNHPYLAAGLRAWQVFNANIKAFYDQHPDQCLLAHIDGLVADAEQFAHLLKHKLQLNVRLDSAKFNQIYRANELQRATLPPDAVDVLARLCPEPLKLYDCLNTRADLSPATTPYDSTASPSIAALASYAGTLSDPISLPVKDSILQLLVSLLAPEPAETMLSRFHQNIRGAQRTVEHLWLEVQRLEGATVDRDEWLRRQQTQFAAQQAQLEVQQTQLETQRIQLEIQQSQLEDQQTQLESQRAELQQVYDTPAWKLIRSYSRIKEKWQRKAG